MPLYEYLCEKCGSKFELIEKFSDSPKLIHEGECGGPVHRLISAPALQFKGTGFYITDYAKSGASKSDSKKSSEGKSESKDSKDSKSSDSSKSSSSDSSSSSSSSTPASTTTSSSSSSSDSKS